MIIRIRARDMRKAQSRWFLWRESRVSTALAGIGLLILIVGMGLYLIRNPLSFGFLAAGPIIFLAAILFDFGGGRRE